MMQCDEWQCKEPLDSSIKMIQQGAEAVFYISKYIELIFFVKESLYGEIYGKRCGD
jgi:hypothetical protein